MISSQSQVNGMKPDGICGHDRKARLRVVADMHQKRNFVMKAMLFCDILYILTGYD